MSEEEKVRVLRQIESFGYRFDDEVKRAFMTVDRREFVPNELKDYAYVDTPLPIGYGQTISAIHMSLIICQMLELREGMKVLEVGAGSGYNAALIAEIVAPAGKSSKGSVFTVERVPELAKFATDNLRRAGYLDRVRVIVGDGTLGYEDEAPYDRISVTAASPEIPPPLIEQLREGGLMIIPIGRDKYYQELTLIKKFGHGKIKKKYIESVAFVPLIGKYGWKEWDL
ncbi:MAG: protein-L-isoaspartate(D-aspartate) O-methyltransferase [Candidatus Asgardarchaeia archaeon]